MKINLTILFFLAFVQLYAGRNITLKTTATNTIRYTVSSSTHILDTANVDWGMPQAGDTFHIPTSVIYQDFSFFNLIQGTESNPIVFVKSGAGQVRIQRGSNGLVDYNPCRMAASNFKFRFDLNLNPGETYGCIMGGYNTYDNYAVSAFTGLAASGGPNSYNFELAGIEFAYCGRGIFHNPGAGNSFNNIYVHDCWWHDLTFGKCTDADGCTAEGTYMGKSNASTYTSAPRGNNIKFINNKFERLAGDGLQFKFITNLVVENNYFYLTGFGRSSGQGDALQIGEFCDSVFIRNNIFDSTIQHAILTKGAGLQIIENNIFMRISNKASTNDAIYINASNPGSGNPILKMICQNNTFLNDTLGNALINNASNVAYQDSGSYIQNCDTGCVSLKGSSSLYQLRSKDREVACNNTPVDPVYQTDYYFNIGIDGRRRIEKKVTQIQ